MRQSSTSTATTHRIARDSGSHTRVSSIIRLSIADCKVWLLLYDGGKPTCWWWLAGEKTGGIFFLSCAEATHGGLVTKFPLFCTKFLMADWINCFCLHEACVPSREWQRLTASVCSIMRSTDSVYWTVWWEEDLFSYRKKKQINKWITWSLCFWFWLAKKLDKNNPPLSSSPTCRSDSFHASSHISVSFFTKPRFKSWNRLSWWWMICKPQVSVCLEKKYIMSFLIS